MKPFLFLLLMIGCGAPDAQSQPWLRPQSREVWISPDTYGDPAALLKSLDNALRTHLHAKRFHFGWGTAYPHGGDGGELIYDKKRQVLWISQAQSGLWPQDGETEEDARTIYNASRSSQQWFFSGVTPNRLKLLFECYNGVKPDRNLSATAYQVSFFPRLSQFGCRGGLVGRTSKFWHEKYSEGRRIRLRS